MKPAVYIIVLGVAMGSCRPAPPPQEGTYSSETAPGDEVGDEVIDAVQDPSVENEYTIVVVQKEGMTDADVKAMAREKAAELTRDEGFCYYTVEKEENVRVLASEKSDFYNQDNPPPDLYEQHIQRKDLRRNGIVDFNSSNAKEYPAYQMTIRLYKQKPGFKGIKVC